jgi:transcriptional regulator with XRE-family HTH domain
MRRLAIGRRLKHTRASRGLSQAQLGRVSGVGQAYISSLEAGRQRNPGIETLRKLAKALGVPITALLE